MQLTPEEERNINQLMKILDMCKEAEKWSENDLETDNQNFVFVDYSEISSEARDCLDSIKKKIGERIVDAYKHMKR